MKLSVLVAVFYTYAANCQVLPGKKRWFRTQSAYTTTMQFIIPWQTETQ